MTTVLTFIALGALVGAFFYQERMYFKERTPSRKKVAYTLHTLGILLSIATVTSEFMTPMEPRVGFLALLFILFSAGGIFNVKQMARFMRDDSVGDI